MITLLKFWLYNLRLFYLLKTRKHLLRKTETHAEYISCELISDWLGRIPDKDKTLAVELEFEFRRRAYMKLFNKRLKEK